MCGLVYTQMYIITYIKLRKYIAPYKAVINQSFSKKLRQKESEGKVNVSLVSLKNQKKNLTMDESAECKIYINKNG